MQMKRVLFFHPVNGCVRAKAKKSQNPIGNLISVPLENNFEFGVGPRIQTSFGSHMLLRL